MAQPRDAEKSNVLVVEDNTMIVECLRQALDSETAPDIHVDYATSLDAMKRLVSARQFDAILLDLSLPDSDGIQTLDNTISVVGATPVLVFSNSDEEALGQLAIKHGAQDSLVKQPNIYGALPRILRYAAARGRLQASNHRLLQAQQYTERLLSKVFSICDIPLCVTDPVGNFLLTNQTMGELIGRSPTELVGKSFFSFVDRSLRDAEHSRYKHAIASKVNYEPSRELILLERGGPTTVAVRAAVVEIDRGRFCQVLAMRPEVGRDASQPSVAANTVEDHAAIRDKVAAIAERGGGQVVTGQLQFVGLTEIQERLGADWERFSQRALETAEKIVRKRLATHDTFMRTGDTGDEFLICFAELDERAAQFKAKAIAREIRESLIGIAGDQMDGMSLDPAERDAMTAFASSTRKIKVASDDLENPDSLAQLLKNELAKAEQEMRKGAGALLKRIHQEASVELHEIRTRLGKTAPFSMAGFDRDAQIKLDQLLVTADSSKDVVADADMLLLSKVAGYIYERQAMGIPIIAVPMTFSTLSDKNIFFEYAEICRNFAPSVRNKLILNVCGMPADLSALRFNQLMLLIRPFAKALMITLEEPRPGTFNLREGGVSLVGIDYRDSPHILPSLAPSSSFVQRIRGEGVRLFLSGVDQSKVAAIIQKTAVELFSTVGDDELELVDL